MFYLGFVAGDEYRVEAAVADLHCVESREIRVRQVFFVGHVEMGPAWIDRRVATLGEIFFAWARAGDAQRDQIHVEPTREILADKLAEAFGQAIGAGRIQGNRFFGGVPLSLAE